MASPSLTAESAVGATRIRERSWTSAFFALAWPCSRWMRYAIVVTACPATKPSTIPDPARSTAAADAGTLGGRRRMTSSRMFVS
jgi:hypothetical protein